MLELRDDGVGFDTAGPAPEGHYGLTMMRERALVAGGTIEVLSASGEGTKISVNPDVLAGPGESGAGDSDVCASRPGASPVRPQPPQALRPSPSSHDHDDEPPIPA